MYKAYSGIYRTAKNGYTRYQKWELLPSYLRQKIEAGNGVYNDGLFTHTRGPDDNVVFLKKNKNLSTEAIEDFEKRYADSLATKITELLRGQNKVDYILRQIITNLGLKINLV
jgi:hypothetical protein